MTKKITLSTLLILIAYSLSFGQADNEFWFVAPEVDAGHGDVPIFLRITAQTQDAIVTIGQPANTGGIALTQTVPANTTVSINLTNFKVLLENQPANIVLNKGIQILSSMPITAYYEVANTNNPEIFPLKGSNALGQFFYLPGQNTFPNQIGTPAFDIVASENNTTVTIVPSGNLVGHAANIPFVITLDKGETFSCVGTNVSALGTLAGSKITSNKPIAVTHSDDSLFSNGAFDLIGDQIVPVNILGTEYIAIKGWATNERIYVVATEDNTTYYLNGNVGATVNINAGQLQSYPITGSAVYLTADKPVYVLHLSGNSSEMADALLPPIECTGSDNVGFVRTASGTFTILVATTVGNEGSFLVNGLAAPLQATNFFPIPGNPNWVGARVNLSTTQAPVGSNKIENTSGLFHLGILNAIGASSAYGYFSSYSTLNLGEDKTVCIENSPIQLDGGSNGSSFLWNDGSTNRFLNVTQPGQYTVQTTSYNCVLEDTVNINILNPQIELGNDTVICQGQTITFDATQPLMTYEWMDGSTNAILTALDTGYYSVTITDSIGCMDSSDIYIGYYQTISLPADEVFICDSTTFTITPNLTEGTFLWSTGETTTTIAPTTTDTYWVEFTNLWGCVSRDTMVLIVPDIPIINLGNDTTVCLNQPIFLDATIPNVVSYLWQDGSTNATFSTTVAGTYIVEAENWHTCHAYDTIIVQQNQVIPFIGIDTMICHNTPLVLNATPYNMTYIWQDGSTNPTLTVINPGIYWVQLTDSINCVGTDSIVIGQHPITQVDLDIDLMYVCDSTTFTIYPNYTTGGFEWQDATTTSTFVTNTIGFYDVEYTDANTCISKDTMELFAPPIPMVNLGVDTILCHGDSLVLNAYQPYKRSFLWQDGSTDSIFIVNSNISGVYHVELTDTNGCQTFDTITVLYNHVTPQLRTDTSICYSTTIPINGTYNEANISYLWSTSETTPIITATQDTTYWLQLTDSIGCQGSDTFNLAYDPFADLGLDISFVCDSIFKTLDSGVPAGTFLWQDGSINPTFLPSVQGTYWVEIWDINGCYSTDTVTLVPVTSPIADIGSDVNICIGQTVVLDATTNFIRQYVWQDGSNLAPFNAIATGEYIVEIIDSNGCNDFDTAMVWVNEVIPNLGADTAICDLTLLPLNATQPNMVAYLWQDGTTNPNYTAAAGLYYVTLTDTLGCQGVDSIFITYRQTADIGPDITFICDSVTFSLSANIPGIYQWNAGQPDSTITNNQEGTYYLNIFDSKGCFSSDTVNVNQITHPIVSLGNDTTYCIGQTYLLDATESFVRSYTWQDGSPANTYLTNSTGLYTVELTDSFGCKAYDSVMVYVNEVIVELGNDTTLCHDSPIVYNITQPNLTYSWQDGSTSGIYTVNSPGTYAVTATDTVGCTDSDAVTVSHFPTISLGADRLFKCDSSFVTVIPNFTSAGSLLWQNGTTTPAFIATQPQTVAVRYIDLNGCISADTMQIVPPPTPPLELGNDTTLCENAIYNISIFNGVGRSYLWQDGSTNDNFTVTETGTYYTEITDTNGCTNSDTIYIDYFLNQDLDLGNDTIICENIAWQISLNVTGAVRYEWQDGTTGANYTISTDGMYWVNAYDVNNCPISDTIIVTTEAVPSEILYVPTDTTICNKNGITVTAFSPYATDYLWEGESAFYEQNDVTNTAFIITYPGTYSITASNRCAGITQFLEVEEEDCGCYPFVPNGFTPNDDGRNDVFKVFSNCLIQGFEMSVYDRWANQVYFSTDATAGWDGTFRGQQLQTGVYVWQMRFSALDERGILTTQVLSGDVTLVK